MRRPNEPPILLRHWPKDATFCKVLEKSETHSDCPEQHKRRERTTERTMIQSLSLTTPTIFARVHIRRQTNVAAMNHVVKAAAIWFGPVPPMPRLAVGEPADSSAELEKFMALLQCDEMGKVKKQEQECFPSLQMINCRVIAVFKRPKSIVSLRGTAEQGPPKPKPWLAEQSIRASPETRLWKHNLELVAPGTTFPAPQYATSEQIRTSRGAPGTRGLRKTSTGDDRCRVPQWADQASTFLMGG